MTDKQKERIYAKIEKYKKGLAQDKKRWFGQYHDGGGLRYACPPLYIQVGDYKQGMRYMNWFNKIFPDDSCYAKFFFEWTILLFKNGKMKEARKMALKTFRDEIYLFDKFFGRPIIPIVPSSSLERRLQILEAMSYSSQDENLLDFAEWLQNFLNSAQMLDIMMRMIALQQQKAMDLISSSDCWRAENALIAELK